MDGEANGVADEGNRYIDSARWVAIAGFVVFTLLFLKNAWVDEDAYISLRAVEQIMAGNGPRWNPHERVQAFSHPLWFGVLVMARALFSDPYLATLIACYACCLVAGWALMRIFEGAFERGLLLGLLLCSRSFFDFTSSGLENPLAYALLSSYLLVIVRATRERGDGRPASLLPASLLLSLLLLVRHDLLLLALPAWAYALYHLRARGAVLLFRDAAFGSAPFVLWTVFSLFYYGFPFPNTAYAKLATGVPSEMLFEMGIEYIQVTARYDPLTVLMIAGGIAVAWPARRSPLAWALALGVAAQLIYLTRVGGDYMMGRFLTSSYLVACVSLVLHAPRWPRLAPVVPAVLLVYALVLPRSPLTTGADYRSDGPYEHGITDTRGRFFPMSSIYQWFENEGDRPFPHYKWSDEGEQFARSDERVRVRANVGFMGFHAGTEKILIDRLALTDPLLARLPARPSVKYKPGHFPRFIPAGYLDSIEIDESQIGDEGLRAYHEKLITITRAPLFSPGRLETILRMNLGEYDGWLRDYDPRAGRQQAK